ncbi:MAG: 50S ribosomal protein L21 [Chloroflexota bacterium]
MYAVIETGGKQYRVEYGSELAIERIDAAPGETIDLERVLLVADGDNRSIGTPLVSDATVTASVVRQDRGEKLIVFKYRPKARHRSKRGHRQEQTIIRIADIRFGGRSAADDAKVEERQAAKARAAAAADAAKKAAADQALAAKLEKQAADEAATAEKAKPTTKKATAAKAEPKAKAKAEPKAKSEPKAMAAPKSTASKAAAKPKPAPAAKKATTSKPAAVTPKKRAKKDE